MKRRERSDKRRPRRPGHIRSLITTSSPDKLREVVAGTSNPQPRKKLLVLRRCAVSDGEAAWSMRHGLVAGLSLAGWGVASMGGEEEEEMHVKG
jgi:hypothetical protein